MKVLIIPTWYPRGKDKLMGIYHKEYAEALGERPDIDVDMLFVERQRLKKPISYLFMHKFEVLEEKNYKVYITKMLNTEKISFKQFISTYVNKLDKAFQKYLETNTKPDILHAEVIFPAGYAASVLGTKYNIPVVVTEHATYYKRFFRDKYIKYTDFVLHNAYMTAVSKYMLDILPYYVKNKKVIPNLVDIDTFKLDRKKIKGLRIAKVCAFRNGKRVEDLLEALKLLIDEYKVEDVLLTIVGDGFLKNDYVNKCHELGLDEYVNFVGQKTKDGIAEILNQNNVFVITSDNETFCIPGIEALASGMPLVSTRCYGPEEYITKDCGIFVDVGDIKAIAKAIYDVYQNQDKYDAKKLRAVADNYSKENVINTALEVYNYLLKNKK